MRILANDFGQNHGFTLYEQVGNASVQLRTWEKHYGLTGHKEFRDDLRHLLTPHTIFLGERFLHLHEFADRAKIDYTPAEYIGVAKLFCQQNFITDEWQNAAQACGATAFWGDAEQGGNAKIQKLGLWQPGKRHAMDSLRHLLYYVSFEMKDQRFIQQLRR